MVSLWVSRVTSSRTRSDRPFHRGQSQEGPLGKVKQEDKRAKVAIAEPVQILKSLIEEGGGAHLHNAEHGAVHFSAKAQPWDEAYALLRGFQDHFPNQPPGRGGGDGAVSCQARRIYLSLLELIIYHIYVSKQDTVFDPAAPVNVSRNKLVSRMQARPQAAQCGCSVVESQLMQLS